jgi:hypothetical protein
LAGRAVHFLLCFFCPFCGLLITGKPTVRGFIESRFTLHFFEPQKSTKSTKEGSVAELLFSFASRAVHFLLCFFCPFCGLLITGKPTVRGFIESRFTLHFFEPQKSTKSTKEGSVAELLFSFASRSVHFLLCFFCPFCGLLITGKPTVRGFIESRFTLHFFEPQKSTKSTKEGSVAELLFRLAGRAVHFLLCSFCPFCGLLITGKPTVRGFI